jgi:hypothetical protein
MIPSNCAVLKMGQNQGIPDASAVARHASVLRRHDRFCDDGSIYAEDRVHARGSSSAQGTRSVHISIAAI